ncbi:MAG: YceH family protein [Acidimicrobiia bacterium]|nr:YceH family protein [Acidimicrobiia bacterium]MDH5289390.1 YceH family protein [Acidimicrobiia bacterium]
MTVILSGPEARILGSLVEKAATTPDNYPLSTNALRAACNQISNREPVVDYDDRLIDAVMLDLRQRGLARTVHQAGSRVSKHRHVLDEALGLAPDELAVLAVLLLRGPQTVAELTSRTERYAGGPVGPAGVEAVIGRLATPGADDGLPLVARLPRRVGEREARVAHLLYDPEEAPAGVRALLGDADGPVIPLMATGHAAHPPAVAAVPETPHPPAPATPPAPGAFVSASAPASRAVASAGAPPAPATPGAGAPVAAPPVARVPTAAPQGAGAPADARPAAVGPLTATGGRSAAGVPPVAERHDPVSPGVTGDGPGHQNPGGGALAREVVELRRRVETLETAFAEQEARLNRLVEELGG